MNLIRIENGIAKIGDKEFPQAEIEQNDFDIELSSGLLKHRTRRMYIKYANGWGLSIIWGTGTYSPNYNPMLKPDAEWFEEVPSAEIAIIKPGGGLLQVGDDTVIGHVSADLILEIDKLVSSYPLEKAHEEV